jgi:uncharacterized protein YcaQ
MPDPTLDDLRRYAVARSLFTPTTLPRAVARLGFIQADPIRAPARAQDLTLRHRVTGYLAGDLERRYARLGLEEDCLVNYGFLAREHVALMHPRVPRRVWDAATRARARAVLAFVRERGEVHPREVDAHFAHGRVVNYWGGSSSATTHLLDGMHYRGLLRVVRREAGTRIYAAHEHLPRDDTAAARRAQAAALVKLVVDKYAPLPSAGLGKLVSMLRLGAPHLTTELKAALPRVKTELASTRIEGVSWYWPPSERPTSARHAPPDRVRLLAPFDPVVWDRIRFELLWGWAYRFEAYVPAPRRKLGYYALPLLWRDRVVGWGNLSVRDGTLQAHFGYVDAKTGRDRGLQRELDAELERMRVFLRL